MPAPAADACPNIDGTQENVPAGYFVAGNGDCIDVSTLDPEPTPEEQCTLDGGTWNSETASCDMPPTPEVQCAVDGGTWNIETNLCDMPPTPAEECATSGGTWENDACTPAEPIAEGAGTDPVDVCPNIDGVQESIPAGYHLDGLDCIEDSPTTQTPPPPEEQCALDGGTWNIETASCDFPPPPPPPDVCPNIDGLQESVPFGYVLFDGECLPEELVTIESDVASSTDGTGGLFGGSILTMDATATTTVNNNLNVNRTNLNGPGETQSSLVSSENTNKADLKTASESIATTGENTARGGVSHAKVETGKAIAAANVTNIVNSNFFNSDGLVLLFDQLFEGGIDLNTYDLSYFFEGGQGSSPVGPEDWEWNDENSNGSIQSSEIVKGCTITTCLNSSTLQSLNVNDAFVTNNVVVLADTGKNVATSTDEGDAEVWTGNAYAAANVFNMVNTNLMNSSYLFVTYNNFGDLSENILLPRADFFEALLANGGYLPSMQSSTFDVTPTNDADFVGAVSASAETGDNATANVNVGEGEIAGPGGVIVTGDAYSASNSHTDLNSTLVGGASVYLHFRVWGEWSGTIQGLPNDVSWEKTIQSDPESGDIFTDIVIYSDNQCDEDSTRSRCEPVPPETIGLFQSSGFLATSTNKAFLENSVDVRAVTGENFVETERGVGGIATGDAYAVANVMNLVNTNVVQRDLVYGSFNIVGDWSGDISFGIGTLQEEPTDVCPNVTGVQESGPCADTVCTQNGGTWDGTSCIVPPPPPPPDNGGSDGSGGGSGSTGGTENSGGSGSGSDTGSSGDTSNSGSSGSSGSSSSSGGGSPSTSSGSSSGGGGGGGGGGGASFTSTATGTGYVTFVSATSTPGTSKADPDVDPYITVNKTATLSASTTQSMIYIDYKVVVTNDKWARPAYHTKLTDTLYDPWNRPMYTRSWPLGTLEAGDQVVLTYTVEFDAKKTKPGTYRNVGRMEGQRNETTYAPMVSKMPPSEGWGDVTFAAGQVLGASAEVPPAPTTCEPLLTSFLKAGTANYAEVKKLQQFLAQDQAVYPEAIVSGYYGSLTARAVTRFQEKYASDILTPIGLRRGTGSVGPATMKKINGLACGMSSSSVTTEENAASPTSPTVAQAKPAPKAAPKPKANGTRGAGVFSTNSENQFVDSVGSWLSKFLLINQ